jgi:hypothetical protein
MEKLCAWLRDLGTCAYRRPISGLPVQGWRLAHSSCNQLRSNLLDVCNMPLTELVRHSQALILCHISGHGPHQASIGAETIPQLVDKLTFDMAHCVSAMGHCSSRAQSRLIPIDKHTS